MQAKTQVSRRIQQHISNLNSPDAIVSQRAEQYLIRYYGTRALEPLCDACYHTNPTVRFRAVWVLGYTQDERTFDTILRLTDDTDARVRFDATIALGILSDLRAIKPLQEIFLSNDETRPAGMAFIRLGLVAIPALEELLQEDNPEVRWSVTQVLGNFVEEFQDAHCIVLLESCKEDSSEMVRDNVEFWLKIAQDIKAQAT